MQSKHHSTGMVESSLEERSYWESLVKEWEKVGGTQFRFCESKGIDLVQFSYWRNKFTYESTRDSQPKFAPVQLKATPVPSTIGDPIELFLPNGVRLLIPTTANMAQLKVLLPVLGVSAC